MARDRNRPIHRTGTEARGGEIVLRTRRQRGIFLGGLFGAGVLALVLGLVGFA